jgi:UDP-N-acetylglucosamine 2-epimerase
MKRIKLMTILGTRPEIIKLSEIIKKAEKYFSHTIVHTGQNYDYKLNKIFFEEFGIREPDFYLNVSGENLGETLGNILSKSYDIMLNEKPDAILILGDTNSCLCSISAKRLKIPIFHLEAGNRSFDENLPEEVNRKIVDHISDVNLCYSEHARRYLSSEGRPPERTFVVGSTLAEVLDKNIDKINRSKVLEKLNLEKDNYILLSAHREENIDIEKNFNELINSINSISSRYNMPVIYSVHPRSKKMIEKRKIKFDKNIRSLEPFGFFDYNKLQKNAYCVISDSGTIAEESNYFKFPAVSIRTSTERPEAIDKGTFILGSITENEVLQSVSLAVEMKKNHDLALEIPDYLDRNVSMKVIKIIQSYIGIVNKFVWKK